MKSFLLIGQSNMAGRGFVNEVPPIYNEDIVMLRNGRWQIMREPIHLDRTFAGIGLAASFAESWCKDITDDKICLIPCAEGGSSIDQWSVDGVLFRRAINDAKFAMSSSEIVGVLWHQGESDSQDGKYKEYYNKLSEIFDAIRRELSLEDIPFIIGGLGDYLEKSAVDAGFVEYKNINEELIKYAKNNNNCYFVTSDGLFTNPDGIHINSISLRVLGVRYYEAYRSNKHIFKPLLNEKEIIESYKMD